MQVKIDDIKPDWTNRRKVIRASLIVLNVLLFAALGGAILLGLFGKFGLYVSTFFIVFNALTFVAIIAIIGSYVFGARWETSTFLKAITNIVPDFGKKDDDIPPES